LSFCTAKQLQSTQAKEFSSCSFIIKLANTFGEEKMSDKTGEGPPLMMMKTFHPTCVDVQAS
jgi:hypothetical protein